MLHVTDVNECLPNPCLNGGNCTDLANMFWCDCPPGIGGRKCEYSKFIEHLNS